MTSRIEMGEPFISKTNFAIVQYSLQTFRGALGQYDRIVFPCAGRFGMVEAAVDAGWRTNEIRATDINIVSALIGHMAAGLDIDALHIDFPGDSREADWARTKFAAGNHVAAVFMMMKFYQFGGPSTLQRMVYDELWRERDLYGNQFQGKVARLTEKLRDLDFGVEDVFQTSLTFAEDDRTLIVIDPWRAQGEAFACVGEVNQGSPICWQAPVIAPFDPKVGMERLHNILMHANALALFHGRRAPQNYRNRTVFAIEQTGAMTNGSIGECVYCNRPDEARRLIDRKKETEIEASHIPALSNEHDITEQSVVKVLPCENVQAAYYADLWGYMRPVRQCYSFFVIVDDFIAGLVGVSFLDIRQSRGPWVQQVYCMVPGYAAPHLLDLCVMAMLSKQAQCLLESMANAPLFAVDEYRLVQVWDEDTFRPAEAACMRIVSNEQLENRQYLLQYRAKCGRFDLSTIVSAWKEFAFRCESLQE